MTTKQAIKYFKGVKALADKLGLWPQAIYRWGKYPPFHRQYEIQILTNGKLKLTAKAK